MAVGGTRKVAVMKLDDLNAEMGEVANAPADEAGFFFPGADMKAYFQNANKEQLVGYMKKYVVWTGTISAYDFLYLPAGTRAFSPVNLTCSE